MFNFLVASFNSSQLAHLIFHVSSNEECSEFNNRIRFCLQHAAAGREEHRRLRGRRDGEVPQPEGRAGGAAREARRRTQVGCLQQVIDSRFGFLYICTLG
jgi:hypothetical protein